MKKILQKSYAWLVAVVMAAVSMSAMADSMTFSYEELVSATSKNNVSISYSGAVSSYGNYCFIPSYTIVTLTATNGANIQGVKFTEAASATILLGTNKNGASLSNNSWTNNVGQDEVQFFFRTDGYVSSMTVTYTPGSNSNPTYDYTVVLNNAPSGAKISVNGASYGVGEIIRSENKLSTSDVNATRYLYTTNVSVDDIKAGESGNITVDYTPVVPDFPKQGVKYILRNLDSDLYLKIVANETKCVVLSDTPDPVTFTFVEGQGFKISNDNEYWFGKSSVQKWYMAYYDPELWEVLETEPGQYVFHCSEGYFGFNTDNTFVEGVGGFRNKGINEHAKVAIEEYAPASAKGYSDGQYFGTYYNSINWVVPANCTAYTVSGVSDGSATLVSLATAGQVVAADVPVLLVADRRIDGVAVKGSSNSGESPADENLLVGTSTAATVGSDGAKYYVLTLKDGNLAFCWDRETNDDGASAALAAHKACLRVPSSNSNMLSFRFGNDTLTGIETIATEKEETIYNLQGQRVNATAAGIYVKNGKKYIVK